MNHYLSGLRSLVSQAWSWFLARMRDHQARMSADGDYRDAVLEFLDAVVSTLAGRSAVVGRGLVTVYGRI